MAFTGISTCRAYVLAAPMYIGVIYMGKARLSLLSAGSRLPEHRKAFQPTHHVLMLGVVGLLSVREKFSPEALQHPSAQHQR